MIEIVLFFMSVCLLLYIIFGGADYGAGMLEALPLDRRLHAKRQEVINRAMGPVWEANHIWLILIVVILFMGFPQLFIQLMITFHYPILAILLGVVFRGCAFTFRHYDAIKDEKTQRLYSLFFIISSFWTTFWLGVVGSSLTRGTIDLDSRELYSAYINPWLGAHPFSVGVFLCFIFMFLASTFLVGETKDEELEDYFTKRSRQLNIGVFLSGGVVFASSYFDPNPLYLNFLGHPLSMVAIFMATILLVVMFKMNFSQRPWKARVLASAQVTMILAGWFILNADNPLVTVQDVLSFYDYAAPSETLKQLVIALIVGSLFIFPALFFLFKVFKEDTGLKSSRPPNSDEPSQ